MEQVFAVFGDPIAHSLSPIMHNASIKALGVRARYHAFKVSRRQLRDALLGAQAMGFGGVNLTIPLKEEALKFVEPDTLAAQIGAINTVDFKEGIRGYNTDGIGAKRAIESAGVSVRDKTVLLLGAGGTARAIAFQLASDGAELFIANRTIRRAQRLSEAVSRIGTAQAFDLSAAEKLTGEVGILINTTSLGMHPGVDEMPLPPSALHPGLVVFDIVYNPLKTRLLREAEKAGAKIVTGEKMLLYQGAEAFKIWTGISPIVDVMHRALLEALEV